MKNLRLLALAATVCLAASAQASVVLNFNMPALVGFNPDGTQTLVEQGYQLNGPQFSFLPIDNAGNGVIVGDGTPFSLQQVGGGIFSLLSLGYAFDDIFGWYRVLFAYDLVVCTAGLVLFGPLTTE